MVKKFFHGLRQGFGLGGQEVVETEEEYVELAGGGSPMADSKVMVRPYILEDFADVKEIVDALRQGYTIALVNIAPLKEKDLVELKRAISKLKKTVDAIEGDIAGFSDDYIVAAPSFATIYRTPRTAPSEEL